MAEITSIQFYRGTRAGIPALAVGKPGFCTDTFELAIGSSGGNVYFASGGSALTDGDKTDITVAMGGTVWTINDGAVDTLCLADEAVTDGKLRDSAPLSVIGRAMNSSGSPGDITAAVNGYVLQRGGDAVYFGLLTADNFEDGSITFGQMADVPQGTVVARKTGGTGPLEECSASDVLDFIDDTHGDVLYRDSGAWAALSPGTAGQFLRTAGPGADPEWAFPASSSAPATAGSAGAAGMIAYDASYLYICIATDTWKRVAIATW